MSVLCRLARRLRWVSQAGGQALGAVKLEGTSVRLEGAQVNVAGRFLKLRH